VGGRWRRAWRLPKAMIAFVDVFPRHRPTSGPRTSTVFAEIRGALEDLIDARIPRPT